MPEALSSNVVRYAGPKSVGANLGTSVDAERFEYGIHRIRVERRLELREELTRYGRNVGHAGGHRQSVGRSGCVGNGVSDVMVGCGSVIFYRVTRKLLMRQNKDYRSCSWDNRWKIRAG